MPTVTYRNGTQREVKNLRWLLQHAREVKSLSVNCPFLPGREASLLAVLQDGRRYTTDFSCMQVLWDFLYRPTLQHKPLRWFGLYYLQGRNVFPRYGQPPTAPEEVCIASS